MSSPYDESSSLALEQTELEVVTNIVQGHQPMMTVLSSRHRNLQVIYNLWQNKDAKVTLFFFFYCIIEITWYYFNDAIKEEE